MQNRQETYYLTIIGPRRGERVIASVVTADRKTAENLFACGKRNDKDFLFNGLYSEEEVLHMFKPHTDIVGTFNPSSGSCEQHRDYHRVPVFVVKEDKVYRIKNDKQLLLDFPKDSDFGQVFAVISGKVKPVETVPVSMPVKTEPASVRQSEPAKEPIQSSNGLFSVDSFVSFTDSMDAASVEPDFEEETDIFDADMGEPEVVDVPKVDTSRLYDIITPNKTGEKQKTDTDYISEFDSTFYGAQKTVATSDDFQKNEKLQERFGNNDSGQPIRKQGQSLKDLFGKGFEAGEFKI